MMEKENGDQCRHPPPAPAPALLPPEAGALLLVILVGHPSIHPFTAVGAGRGRRSAVGSGDAFLDGT